MALKIERETKFREHHVDLNGSSGDPGNLSLRPSPSETLQPPPLPSSPTGPPPLPADWAHGARGSYESLSHTPMTSHLVSGPPPLPIMPRPEDFGDTSSFHGWRVTFCRDFMDDITRTLFSLEHVTSTQARQAITGSRGSIGEAVCIENSGHPSKCTIDRRTHISSSCFGRVHKEPTIRVRFFDTLRIPFVSTTSCSMRSTRTSACFYQKDL